MTRDDAKLAIAALVEVTGADMVAAKTHSATGLWRPAWELVHADVSHSRSGAARLQLEFHTDGLQRRARLARPGHAVPGPGWPAAVVRATERVVRCGPYLQRLAPARLRPDIETAVRMALDCFILLPPCSPRWPTDCSSGVHERCRKKRLPLGGCNR